VYMLIGGLAQRKILLRCYTHRGALVKFWQSVSMIVDRNQVEELESTLWDLGALSVTVQDAGDEPLLEPGVDETPLWQMNRVTGLYNSSADIHEVLRHLEAAGYQICESGKLEDRQWEREWLSRFKPMQFGEKLWIYPSVSEDDHESDEQAKIVMRLDPGLAFGTGTHPTTALCLAWLDSMELKGKRLLDYGCGSGILAIAAALFECVQVTGVDNDPQAIRASQENSRKNRVGDNIDWFLVASYKDAMEVLKKIQVDFLVANILAKPLMEMAELLVSTLAPGGKIALSGVMTNQSNEVMLVYQKWIQFEPCVELDGWVLLTGEKVSG